MSGHDPVDVLLVEDDPGDAVRVLECVTQAGRNNRFHMEGYRKLTRAGFRGSKSNCY